MEPFTRRHIALGQSTFELSCTLRVTLRVRILLTTVDKKNKLTEWKTLKNMFVSHKEWKPMGPTNAYFPESGIRNEASEIKVSF